MFIWNRGFGSLLTRACERYKFHKLLFFVLHDEAMMYIMLIGSGYKFHFVIIIHTLFNNGSTLIIFLLCLL